MRVLTVTSGGDDGAGLTLREAVARAGRGGGETLIVFDEAVGTVNLDKGIRIARPGKITIDGDRDGDGIGDVFIGIASGNGHHLTVGARADVTVKDVLFFGASDFAAGGKAGRDHFEHPGNARDGEDGEQLEVDVYPTADENAAVRQAAADRLDEIVLDGGDGGHGGDGRDGGHGGRGKDAAGAIVNDGSLTLVRVGFAFNNAYGGDGGDGGQGERGQHGGAGGNGAVGAVKFPYKYGFAYDGSYGARDSGTGGHGGNGGDGGDGGAGGRGGDAASAVLNRSGGTVTLVDVSFGGRIAHGLLTDQFGMKAVGGAGGAGGNGGDAGDGGSAGSGADDAFTEKLLDRVPTGETFDLWSLVPGWPAESRDEPLVWSGQAVRDLLPGEDPDAPRNRFIDQQAVAEGLHRGSTDAGRGGNGGDGGDGGDAGLNGAGGNAATVVNYGTVRGAGAFGKANSAEPGKGNPSDFLEVLGEGGDAGLGRQGRPGGDESQEYSWRLLPHSIELNDNESWANEPSLVREFCRCSTGSEVWHIIGAPDHYLTPEDAADGLDGADGVGGAAGGLGPDGEAKGRVWSEGVTARLSSEAGLVYLTGVRQSDDFGKLLFSLVRVGDTGDAVSVTYTVGGAGRDGVGRGDFTRPGQLSKTVTFDAIDQGAATFDSDGKGVAHIEIDLRADGIREGAEGFRIDLASGDVALGTSRFVGTVWDADYRSVRGTEGNDRRLNGSRKDDVIDALGGNDRLDGKAGRDVLLGGAGKDTLKGGNGADILNGGAGGDRFVFAGRKAGADTIEDFGRGDVIDLSAYGGLKFRDLDIARAEGGTLVAWDAGSVLLEGVRKAQLDASDFDFA